MSKKICSHNLYIVTILKKTPLDEILEQINEKYKGQFTDADKDGIGATTVVSNNCIYMTI